MATKVSVFVARIKNIRNHPNANGDPTNPKSVGLDIGNIGDWQVVVQRGKYKGGELVVFFEPDTIIPPDVADSLGVRDYLKGPNKDRVGQINLRGEASFGLVITPDSGMKEGDDVAAWYQATKYVPPVRATCGDAAAPVALFHRYTDIQNLRTHPTVFVEGEPVIATEKIDGTNSRVALIDGERYAGSMDLRRTFPYYLNKKAVIDPMIVTDLGQDNIDRCPACLTGKSIPDDIRTMMHEKGIKNDSLYDKVPAGCLDDVIVRSNTYWFPWTLDNVRNLLYGVTLKMCANQVILFGEVCGSMISGGLTELNYGYIGKMGYRAFDLYVDGKYLDYPQFLAICETYSVPTVPILYRGPFNMEEIRKASDGESRLAGHIREGVVVRPIAERNHPEVGRLVMKYLGQTYLLKKKRDFKDE